MEDKRQFIAGLYPTAKTVSAQTGMSWELMLAQAALESDWGRQVPEGTHNLFGIQVGGDWHGERRVLRSHEYVGGEKVFHDLAFRAYASIEEALRDRVKTLQENPRNVREGLFDESVRGDLGREVSALRKAGYSTDSRYAERIEAVFNGRAMQEGIGMALDRPLVSDPRHPNHDLYAALAGRLPPGTPPETVANVAMRVLEYGITGPDRLQQVAVQDNCVFVSGRMPGERIQVNLEAPMSTLQQASDAMSEQVQQASRAQAGKAL